MRPVFVGSIVGRVVGPLRIGSLVRHVFVGSIVGRIVGTCRANTCILMLLLALLLLLLHLVSTIHQTSGHHRSFSPTLYSGLRIDWAFFFTDWASPADATV